MKMLVERTWCGPVCTIGVLSIAHGNEWRRECFTLEDVVRERAGEPVEAWKVRGETAISKGVYRVVITYSNRFKRDLPLLVDVPGFSGVRIHPGNTAADTEGCLLVGRAKGPSNVTESRLAFADLYEKIERAIDAGEVVTLEIA
jgi:hypothetical protein